MACERTQRGEGRDRAADPPAASPIVGAHAERVPNASKMGRKPKRSLKELEA